MLNTPAARIDSLPPLYGGGGGMTPVAPTPPVTRDHQGPKIIVGNALAGDTIDVCDYLDVGDGVQLQAALTAAGVVPRKDVWLRPGTITVATPLNVPTQVTLRGAGGVLTVLRNTPANRQVLIANVRALVTDLSISTQAPQAGCVGTELLRVFGNATLARIRLQLSASAAGIAALETITALIREDTSIANYTSVSLMNIEAVGYSFRRLGLAKDLVGIELTHFGADSLRSCNTLVDTSTMLCDIGYDLRGPHIVSACESRLASRIAATFSSEAGGRNAPVISGSYFDTTALTGTPQFGVVFATGANASGLLDAKMTGCTVTTTSVDAASTGIALQGTGDGVIVDGCSVAGFALGVDIAATQINASMKGSIRGATAPVTDASGSLLNEMRVV